MKKVVKWINKMLQRWTKRTKGEGVGARVSIDSIPTRKIVNDSTTLIKSENHNLNGDNLYQPTLTNSRYQVGSLIGEGSFGLVCEAYDTHTSQHVALKFIYRDRVQSWIHDPVLGPVPSEVYYSKALSVHRHPNIIKFIDYFERDAFHLVLVTELHGKQWRQSENGSGFPTEMPRDLFEFIESSNGTPLPDQLVYFIFHQLLSTVLFLHSIGLFHRDIKDENVLIDAQYRIKLIDFGSCTAFDRGDDMIHRFNGTVAFAAPEALSKKPYAGTPAEVWSLGSLLYTLSFRRAPFQSAQEIRHLPPRLPPYTPDTSLEDLIARMLDKDPSQRIPLLNISSHPWMQSHCQFTYY